MSGTSFAAEHAVDIIVGISLLWSAFRGYTRGLFHEVMSLVALFLAVAAAFRWTPTVMPKLAEKIPGPSSIDTPISFLLVFAATGIALRILVAIIGRRLSGSRANRVGGAFFGTAKGAVALGSTFLMLRTFTPAPLPCVNPNPFAVRVQMLNDRIGDSALASEIVRLTSGLFSGVVDAGEIRLRMLAASDNEGP
jgi:hypothetical protein